MFNHRWISSQMSDDNEVQDAVMTWLRRQEGDFYDDLQIFSGLCIFTFRIFFVVNCFVTSWENLFVIGNDHPANVYPKMYCPMTWNCLWNWSSIILLLQGTPWRLWISLLNVEGGCDKRQVVVLFVHCNSSFFKIAPSVRYVCNGSSNSTGAGTLSNEWLWFVTEVFPDPDLYTPHALVH
jgi:hypothetical protein